MLKRSPALLLLGVLLLAGCGAPSTSPPPSQEQPQPPRSLGGVLITFSGLSGVGPLAANAQTAPGRLPGAQALTGQSGLSFSRLSQGTFTSTDPADGKTWRYLTATFRVTPTTSVTNLSFVARVNTTASPKTQFDTPIVGLAKFDGSPLDNPQAFVQQVRPVHNMRLDRTGTRLVVQQDSADMQVWGEDELSAYGSLTGAYLLPYGFVAQNATGGRAISPSNPGFVTFALRIPKQASEQDDAFSFGMYFEAVADSATRVTHSLEEADGGVGAATRAASLGTFATVNVFPDSDYSQSRTSRLVCNVRTAGPRADVNAWLFPRTYQATGLSPLVNTENVPSTSSVLMSFSGALPAIPPISPSTVPLFSSYRGTLAATYSTFSNSNNVQIKPATALLPGEVVDVGLTRDLRLCPPPPSYRFRAATKPGRGTFDPVTAYDLSALGGGVSAKSGDFNGDGKLDLAVGANVSPGTLDVFFGEGDGTFGGRTSFDLSGPGTSLASGDFNGDGKLDLAASTSAFSGKLDVLLGSATGTFAPKTSYNLSGPGLAVASGDFDADGKLDLAVSTSGSAGKLDIFPGRGNGTFGTKVTYDLSSAGTSVTGGDFNADGKLDLAVSTSGSAGTLKVFFGGGDGTFAAPASYDLSGNGWSVASGDFNGDRRLDLAVGTSDSTTPSNSKLDVFLNQGNGVFGAKTSYDLTRSAVDTASGDFDGDGKLDLVVGTSTSFGGINVFPGRGDGTFGERTAYDLSSSGSALTSGDFDGDGRLDLAFGTGFRKLEVALQSNFRRALSLSGDNRVSLPDSSTYNFSQTQNFTVETWFKTTQTTEAVLVGKWSGGTVGYPFEVRVNGGFLLARRYDGDNNPGMSSTAMVNDGRWHHVAFVKEGSTLRLYLDGQLDATATDTTTASTQNTSILSIGARGNDTLRFAGQLDEVRLWSVARSAAQIQASLGVLRSPYPSGLRTYLKVNGTENGALVNETSSTLSGTPIGFSGDPTEAVDD